MKKLAIYIPTYNRGHIVEPWLEVEKDILKKHDIDVIFYDSSEDDGTVRILERLMEEGYSNIQYKRIDSAVDGNEKALMIYEDAAKAEQYEYIWMTHDHTVYYEEMILYVLDCLEKRADFYMLDMYTTQNELTWFENYNDFLREGAFLLLRYGACIINRERVIKDTDWLFIRDKYFREETISAWHIGYYYERIAQIREPVMCKIKVPAKATNVLFFSKEKKRSWYVQTIPVLAGRWYKVISKLPDVYTDKESAFKTVERAYISKYTTLQYKKEGGFSLQTYFKHKGALKMMSPEDYPYYFWIALLPTRYARKVIYRKLKKQVNRAKKQNKKIVLYGAGVRGVECASYLEEANIPFEAFMVTNIEGNDSEVKGYPVVRAKDYVEAHKVFVIISVMNNSKYDIQAYLDELDGGRGNITYTYFYD